MTAAVYDVCVAASIWNYSFYLLRARWCHSKTSVCPSVCDVQIWF